MGTHMTFIPKRDYPKDKDNKKILESVRVEEIENGFLIVNEYKIFKEIDGEIRKDWCTKKFFSKTNPMKMDKVVEKTLADKL